mmetsp:Transcript_32524/g.80499  ORF Transcript_32524/g.80499 Transcript_32524/m.80499 type:complete len:231 (+) Transcript_32524:262-954(+)
MAQGRSQPPQSGGPLPRHPSAQAPPARRLPLAHLANLPALHQHLPRLRDDQAPRRQGVPPARPEAAGHPHHAGAIRDRPRPRRERDQEQGAERRRQEQWPGAHLSLRVQSAGQDRYATKGAGEREDGRQAHGRGARQGCSATNHHPTRTHAARRAWCGWVQALSAAAAPFGHPARRPAARVLHAEAAAAGQADECRPRGAAQEDHLVQRLLAMPLGEQLQLRPLPRDDTS